MIAKYNGENRTTHKFYKFSTTPSNTQITRTFLYHDIHKKSLLKKLQRLSHLRKRSAPPPQSDPEAAWYRRGSKENNLTDPRNESISYPRSAPRENTKATQRVVFSDNNASHPRHPEEDRLLTDRNTSTIHKREGINVKWKLHWTGLEARGE